MTNDEIKAKLTEHNLHTGFYRGKNGSIRFLNSISTFDGSENSDIFISYFTKASALKALRNESASITHSNANVTGILKWFLDGKFLGFTAEEAGL